jgi:hypothetical protein
MLARLGRCYVKPLLPDGRASVAPTLSLAPAGQAGDNIQGLAMVIDRILRRSALTLRTWVGTNPCLSQIRCRQRRLLGTAPSPASCLERWTKRFSALGFTRGAIPLNRQPRIQTAPAWLAGDVHHLFRTQEGRWKNRLAAVGALNRRTKGWSGPRLSVEEFRKQAVRAAPCAELVLAVLVSIITVSGTKPGHRLPLTCTCVVTGFPGLDSGAADQRNWFRGNSLLSWVGRSVGGERQR